nr:Nuclear transport factor 2 family protein [Ipomoea batatas]GMD31593.1 Nuclear transport factor 2 family protein [Ipomoea batatas]GME15550.1 Nuclear transport factor 2 family protein [Ipomoea batatas]
MATLPSFAATTANLHSGHHCIIFRQSYCPSRAYIFRQSYCPSRAYTVRCNAKNPTNNSSTKQESVPENNVLLKAAWYGSELLGIAASLLRSPTTTETKAPEGIAELSSEGWSGVVDRSLVVDTIKDDFLRSYFVTGNLTLDAYEEECEFADPAGSFKGLRRFKRNCTNFGYLVEKSNMKLMKWEDFEEKAIGHWRFSCVLTFPWKPILSATGYTEYYFNEESGKICRHVEHWNVPKMALFKQILRPGANSKSN